ncbi:MAG: GAF domain-containing protein, partial [Chloroflexota bacterium]
MTIAWILIGAAAAAIGVTLIRAGQARWQAEQAMQRTQRRYQELQAATLRQERDRALLDQLRSALAQDLDLQVLIRRAVDGVARVFGYPLVSLYLRHGDLLRLQHQSGYESVIESIPMNCGISGRVARTGKAVLVRDTDEDSDFLPAASGIVCEICVPLFDREQVLGIFNVETRADQVLDETDLLLVKAVGEVVSIALSRAQLYSAMSALYQTSLEINAQSDLPTLLREITRRACDLMHVNMGGLYLLQEDGQTLELAVGHHLPEQYIGTRLKLGEGLSGRIALSGIPLMVDDYSTWEHQANNFIGSPFRRVMGVPLKSGEQVLGVINITDNERSGLFTAEELRLAMLFADHAALAIRNTRLLEETRRQAEQMAVLNRIAQEVASDLDLDLALQSLYEQCHRLLPMDAFYVAVYEEKTGLLYHPFFIDQGKRLPIAPRDLHTTPGLSGQTLLGRVTLYIDDLLDPQAARHPVILSGDRLTRSYVGIPLVVHERVVGVLSMQSYQPHAYSPAQIRFFETIASQVAAIIDHARLFETLQQTTRYLSMLNQMTAAALQTADMHTLLQTLADRMGELFYADGCYITLWDELHDTHVPAAAYGPERDTYTQSKAPAGALTLTASVLKAARPLAVDDVFNSPYISTQVAARHQMKSILGLPLIAERRKLGAALITFSEPHRFTQPEIEMGRQAADGLALALARSQSAMTDPLTGAYNRRGLFELGKRELKRARRTHQPVSVIMLDIDHFKQVNDAHGHAIGDQALRAVAEMCAQNIRSADLLGRYGGEEFAILLPESSPHAAGQIADRLGRWIRETPIATIAGPIHITVSIGVATLKATDALHPAILPQRASGLGLGQLEIGPANPEQDLNWAGEDDGSASDTAGLMLDMLVRAAD